MTDNLVSAFELSDAPRRKRKPKARDRANQRALFHAILANITMAVVSKVEPPAVSVSLKAARTVTTRYDREGFTGLPRVLEWLDGAVVITLARSKVPGLASRAITTPSFAATIARFAWRPEHFGEAPGRETILLSRVVKDYARGTDDREWRDYADHADADRFRVEVATINAMLATADLALTPDDGPEVSTVGRRTLSRHFRFASPADPDRFDLGGRLYGGWWQNLARERRASLRIDGEPIADLDFRNMLLRLAYLEAGTAPPEGDLYAGIPGLLEPRWRDGLKRAASALLFREGPLVRLPSAAKESLPPEATAKQVRSAILSAHPVLGSVIERGLGHRLTFIESQILVAALLRLAGEGITALPMHDGLMVAQSKAGAAEQALRDASLQIVEMVLPVVMK